MALVLVALLVSVGSITNCKSEPVAPPPRAGSGSDEADAAGDPDGEEAAVHFHPLAEEKSLPARDLVAIRERGELRVLLQRSDLTALPREGSPLALTMSGVAFVAGRLGVEARFVVDPSRQALRQALLDGRGDLLVMQLSPHESEVKGLLVTTPVRFVQEVVVVPGRAGDGEAGEEAVQAQATPRSFEELEHQQIYAGRWFPSFARLTKRAIVGLLEDHLEPAEVLARVGQGEIPMAVAFSEDVAAYLTYREDVEVAFPLTEEVPLVWGVSPEAPRLVEGVNGIVFESALTKHTRAVYGGDLAAIRERKVIRVAMQNDAASYFLFRGQQVGFQYELAERLAKKLEVRLEVVVPDQPSELARLVEEERADLAVLAVTDELGERLQLSRPYAFAEQVLVQPADAEPITALEQLAGKAIHVRRSSSYFELLTALAAKVPDLQIVEAPETSSTEELIAAVGAREIPMTAANSVLLGAELTYRDDIAGTLVLAKKRPLAYGMRQDSPKLLGWLNRYLKKTYRGRDYNVLYKKYFKSKRRMRLRQSEELSTSGKLSPWDDLVQERARQFGLDWRLILAQMYQESRFDPKAKSWAGAVGLMQVMPKTGKGLGYRSKKRLRKPGNNIHAGVMYLSQMIAKFDPDIPMRQRIRFGLAAYNAGLGHVIDARRLAAKKGWDPDRWFGNVERAIRLLEKPRYYRRARYGYCRGSEPADYVSRIQSRYDGYVALVPAAGFDTEEGTEP